MVKPEIKYGLLGATLLIFLTLVQYFLGFHTFRLGAATYSGYLTYIIIFISLWLGLQEKKMDYGGKFTVRRGVKESMYQLFITASISSFFMFIYDYYINPFWVENYIQYQRIHGNRTSLFMLFVNDPNAEAIILSNTETHLCIYFLGVVGIGAGIAFILSAIIANPKARISTNTSEGEELEL